MKKILEDIKILDFTHVWFGPYTTMMLAELGAEVIKIEPPWGTIGRMGPGELKNGVSTTFYALNLGKKGISMDLKNPEVKEMIKELVKQSDVVAQNFAPGTMDRLGFGYDVLKEWNPKIIYAALSGFGQTGPYSKNASYASIAEAMSGHTYATGKNYKWGTWGRLCTRLSASWRPSGTGTSPARARWWTSRSSTPWPPSTAPPA